MKDLVIKAKRVRTELFSFLACFIVANLLNLYAIIAYDTAFTELFSLIGYELLFALALYVLWCLLRIFFYLVRTLFKK